MGECFVERTNFHSRPSFAQGQRVGVIRWGHSVQETRDQKPEAS